MFFRNLYINTVGRNGGSLQKTIGLRWQKIFMTIRHPKTNTFNLSEKEWGEFIKGHPKGKSLKSSPLAFPDLCQALFDRTSATGSHAYAPSSTRERVSVVSSSSFTSHIHTIEMRMMKSLKKKYQLQPQMSRGQMLRLKILQMSREQQQLHLDRVRGIKPRCTSSTYHTATPVVQPPPPPPSSPPPPVVQPRPPPPTIAQIDPVRNACVERLNSLGLDPTDPLYTTAIDILGHTTLLRDAWLMMTPDPNVLRDWIARTGRRLGFMEYWFMFMLWLLELELEHKLMEYVGLCFALCYRFIMDNRQKAILIIVVFLYLYYIRSRRLKRKRDNMSRLTGREFTNELLEGMDTQCIDLLRMSRVAFIQLCAHFKAKGWLTDSKHILVEEKVAIFLMIIGHNQRYRVVKNRFQHSTQTIHKNFHEFDKEIIVPTSFNPNPETPGNNRRLRRIFKGAIGALDGTLVHVVVVGFYRVG
ncbi:hypothetical protein OSB04_012389 [Centaurea solstitialis]|uniref:DUF8040 domain-containing protein n=1 Tax=Centaurea solstitialis TaxID=347529 RepID=A0AA38TB97_9ASTR|nr:hypothetical protein OSB04_012389 [Centaurea solstitialis]